MIRLLIDAGVEVPMADDWLLVKWGTNQTADAGWKDYWATVNGHQLILVKLYLKALGRFASLSLVHSAVIAVCLAALAAMLILGTLPERQRLWFVVFSAGFSALLLNVRQIQNFFLIICFTWVMGLFAVALFVALHRDGEARGLRRAGAMIAIVLAGLTGGLGIVVPLYAAGAYLLDVRRRWKQTAIAVPVAALSVFLATIYPRWLGVYKGPPALGLEFLRSSPLDGAKMFLISIGQPFVPWRASSASIALWLGLAAVVFCAYLIGRSLFERRFRQFVFENPLLICGLLFAVLLVVSRGPIVGFSGALEARYTTGALLVWAGLLVHGWRRLDRHRWIIASFAAGLGILAHAGGSAAGFYYLGAQARLSAMGVECFENAGWSLHPACVDLVHSGRGFDPRSFEKSNRALYDERKAFYVHRNEIEPAAPPAPGVARLVARTAVSTSAVDLTWTYTGDARNFRILRRPRSSDHWNVISEVPGDWRSFHNEPLPACTTFVYRIVPLRESGDAEPSNESVARTLCTPPSDLTAVVVSESQIDLYWADDETPPAVRVLRRGAHTGWSIITELGGQDRSYTNKPLPPCTEFTYRVLAITESGSSMPSDEARAKTRCWE